MEPNPLSEIRNIRRQISRECGDDLDSVLDYYVAQQEKMKASGAYDFVVKPAPSGPAQTASGQRAEPNSR